MEIELERILAGILESLKLKNEIIKILDGRIDNLEKCMRVLLPNFAGAKKEKQNDSSN